MKRNQIITNKKCKKRVKKGKSKNRKSKIEQKGTAKFDKIYRFNKKCNNTS